MVGCFEIRMCLEKHCSNVVMTWFFLAVYADGSICLDILQNRWSPTYDVSAILTSIQVCYKIPSAFSHVVTISLKSGES